MTHNLLILFVSSILASLASADVSEDFTGTWASKTTDAITFSLDLKQRGSRIEGYHNAVAQGGRRVDDVQPDTGHPSISGSVQGRVAYVTFSSGYGDGTGEATITLNGNKLDWKITKSSGMHYLPSASVLHRR
jgi:hypothetical protein